MELKDLIKKNLPALKKILFEEEEKVEVKMDEAKLSDGVTIVKWEGELAMGSPLYVISEEGVTPAPDGTHELEDGRTIVSQDGLITEVKTKEEEKEEEGETEVEIENFAKVEDVKSIEVRVSAIEADSTAKTLVAKFEALKAENETLKTSLKLMFEVVEKISGEPDEVEVIEPENKDKKKLDLFNSIEEVAKILNKK
jgi:hypothetical protein